MFMQKSLLKNNIRKWTANYWSKVEIRSNEATTTLAVATLQKRRISRRSDTKALDTTPKTTALIIGSTGALGSTIASYLHEHQRDTNIIGVDFVMPPLQNQKCLNHFIPLTDRTRSLNSPTTLADLTDQIKSGLEAYDNGLPNALFDVIICTAGGFIPTADYSDPNGFINGVEHMLRQNLYPVIAASHIAATRLKPGGTFNIRSSHSYLTFCKDTSCFIIIILFLMFLFVLVFSIHHRYWHHRIICLLWGSCCIRSHTRYVGIWYIEECGSSCRSNVRRA